MSVDKNTFRKEAKLHRARIDASDPDEDPDMACAHFFKSINPAKDQIVAVYWPADNEFDIGPIIDRLLDEGIQCALPVMQDGSRILRFAVWDPQIMLDEGPYGIMQPRIDENTKWTEPDIICVPLLAFDRKGYRIGYGGGYYDATLSALSSAKQIVSVGVCFAKQAVLFNLPVEAHDQKLDWVITPQNAHRF